MKPPINSLLPAAWMISAAFCFATMGAMAHAVGPHCDWLLVAFIRIFCTFVFSVLFAVFTLVLVAVPALSAGSAHATPRTTPSPTPRTTAKTWTVMVGAQSRSGAIQTMAYGPKKIWIDAGDTVHWVANSMEPHTVSFINAKHPAVAFDPATTYMTAQTAKHTIARPGQFRSSGIMAPDPDAFFPDAVSARGSKHMRELAAMAARGARAVVVFCVQREDALAVRAADEIDPAYGRAMRAARAAGVELLACGARVSVEEIVVVRELPVLG